MTLRITPCLLAAAALLAACTHGPMAPPADHPAPALPPVPQPADNPSTPAKVALGAQLFTDKRLSASGTMACQSCHYRNLQWADAQVFSRKDDGALNTRHTPSLYNVGHQTLWYWDGRARTLEGQVLAAWRGQIGADPTRIVAVLNGVLGYRSQFEAVYGSEATPDAVVKSLGAFLRTLVSDDSPWDRHAAGQPSDVTAQAIEGQALFAGKGRCATCHTPPYYGNSTFFNIGLEYGKPRPDPGRYAVTHDEADRGAFKTPTLRSVALGAPYFHDGSAATLKEAVTTMAGGGRPDPARSPLLQPTGLNEAEIDSIVAFLRTLTSREPWQQPALP